MYFVPHVTSGSYVCYNFVMERKKPTEKQIIGRIGENCACDYLRNRGFVISDRNYRKKWGELDIVAEKGKVIHFVEVKSVSCPINDESGLQGVSCGTLVTEQSSLRDRPGDEYRPEDNMHPWKLQRLSRAIQSYLLDKDISDDIEWQFDVATVLVDTNKRISRVTLMEDVVL